MTGTNDAKLLYPGLAGFYASWRDIAETLVRVIIGYNIFMHGWAKVTGAGAAGVGAYMAKNGLQSRRRLCLCGDVPRNHRRDLHHHRAVHALLRGRARH
jgi:hypothetical protein